MKYKTLKIFSTLLLLLIASGCKSVKEYQKIYLNDAEMELSMRKVQQTENSFQLYREG
ncbi:MAG TPA: DUF4266 domain-containing protein, partial [Chryseolinea sp.]|nr:DUF4266 domain-containing protein [Chryseolinea sp.]